MNVNFMNLGNNRCCVNNIVTEITGPQGSQGAYGNIGEKGNTGNIGFNGLIGATGICYRGAKGSDGYKGAQGGFTGSIGFPGYKGNSGFLNSSQNIYFTFTINTDETYSNSFKELTSLSTAPINNSINLNGNYAINTQLNENWIDLNAQYYIQLNDGINNYYFNVFNPNNSSYIGLNTRITNLLSNCNDTIFNLPNNTYTIKLFQSTNSNSVIQFGGKNVKFSITFIKLS
jgi:hypothetical protein